MKTRLELVRGSRTGFPCGMSSTGYGVGSCQHCSGQIEFSTHDRESFIECPHCHKETMPQMKTAGEHVSDSQISAGELKAALEGCISIGKPGFFYVLGLLFTAGCVLLMPIAYLCVVALFGWGVFWYAQAGLAIFKGSGGGVYGAIVRVVAYLGPLLGGAIAVLFMLKPLLARPQKALHFIELDQARHQRLYQLVAGLCTLLKAPMPAHIYVDCRTNASAGYASTRKGWFEQKRVLMLGLPLIASMDTQQLAAIISHELGHCRQGLAGKLGYLISSVNNWFVRVIYERDAWDDTIEGMATDSSHWIGTLIVACVRGSIWLSRFMLRCLFYCSNTLFCFLLRQMEYDADRCAIAVAGSSCVEQMLLRLRALTIVEWLGLDGMQQFWGRSRLLPDNVPAFYQELEKRMAADFHESTRETLINEKVHWFSSHPTPAQRIRKARQIGAEGCFQLTKPASALFNDFAQVAKTVTERYYRQVLRLPITYNSLKPAISFFGDPAAPSDAQAIDTPPPLPAPLPPLPVAEQLPNS